MIPLDVLLRPISSDDLYDKCLDLLEVVNVPARSWRDGGLAKSIVGMLCDLGAQGSTIISGVVGGFYLAYAAGDYLTAHASDVYDEDRIEATFATGQATLTNVKSVPRTAGANELVITSSNTGARYTVTQAWTLASGSPTAPTSVTVSIMAIVAGSESSVGPEELDTLETPIAGVSVANASSIIGRDAETDDQLRKRCIAKKGTWSPFGPRDAYEYAALTAKLSDGTPTSISRVAVSRFSSTGTVTVVCATPNGTPSAPELAAVVTECEATARPDTVTVLVSGAVQHATSHIATLWAKGGTESVIRANAAKALAAFYAVYPIGGIAKTDGGQGYLYLDAISAVLVGSSVENFDVDFDLGTTDTALAANEVATNTISLTVRIR